MSRALEWLASALICLGVIAIAYGLDRANPVEGWFAFVGVVLLTFGVRLAIDCGKAGRR